jgi:Tol biopolymer transport system component
VLEPTLSRNGRFVAYTSDGTNLVQGDVTGGIDVFRWDRLAHANLLINRATGVAGAQDNGIAAGASISGDGNLIVFASEGTNLGDNETEQQPLAGDIFLRNVALATTTPLSKTGGLIGFDDNNSGPTINDGGTAVAFTSRPRTGPLFRVLVRDLPAGPVQQADVTTVPPGVPSNSDSFGAALTADGRQVAFQSSGNNLVLGDTNNAGDVFVHER